MTKEVELMKISVVIPMYNSKDTIISTLDSIKNQTAIEHILEVIVVNDGSIDNSLDLVKQYVKDNEKMMIFIIDKLNGGVSSARNAGMKVAKGDWIALLDSDDDWLPRKIETQLKTIQEHPEIDFLGGDFENCSLKILWRRIDCLYKASIKDLCLKHFPPTPAAVFRKRIYDEIGGFDENQRYAEDGNYFLKICSHFNYYHLPVPVISCGRKPAFGYSGLSANLKGMYEGNIKNIRELKRDSIISNEFYLFLRVFYWAKYIRRIFITKTKSWKEI